MTLIFIKKQFRDVNIYLEFISLCHQDQFSLSLVDMRAVMLFIALSLCRQLHVSFVINDAVRMCANNFKRLLCCCVAQA